MPSTSWHRLKTLDDLNEAVLRSNGSDVLLYKHSYRCGICTAAMRRLEEVDTELLPIYMVDVVADRPISNAIADRFGVHHESPQAILIRGGQVIAVRSHSSIRPEVFLAP